MGNSYCVLHGYRELGFCEVFPLFSYIDIKIYIILEGKSLMSHIDILAKHRMSETYKLGKWKQRFFMFTIIVAFLAQ